MQGGCCGSVQGLLLASRRKGQRRTWGFGEQRWGEGGVGSSCAGSDHCLVRRLTRTRFLEITVI